MFNIVLCLNNRFNLKLELKILNALLFWACFKKFINHKKQFQCKQYSRIIHILNAYSLVLFDWMCIYRGFNCLNLKIY